MKVEKCLQDKGHLKYRTGEVIKLRRITERTGQLSTQGKGNRAHPPIVRGGSVLVNRVVLKGL